MTGPDKIDKTLMLLFIGTLVFTAILLIVDYVFKDDAQLFQVIAGITTGFAAAFLARMKPQGDAPDRSNTQNLLVMPPPAAPTDDKK